MLIGDGGDGGLCVAGEGGGKVCRELTIYF